MQRETDAREAAVLAERTAREQEDRSIREKLAVSQTGGLHLSVIGVWWLVIGTVLGTLAAEFPQ